MCRIFCNPVEECWSAINTVQLLVVLAWFKSKTLNLYTIICEMSLFLQLNFFRQQRKIMAEQKSVVYFVLRELVQWLKTSDSGSRGRSDFDFQVGQIEQNGRQRLATAATFLRSCVAQRL